MSELAVAEVLEGQIVDREALLDSIAEYATWLQEAERLVQSKSLEKAADLWTLYGEGSWVTEWQEQEPASTDALGKIVDPKNWKRFARWLEWAEGNRGKPAPSSVHTRRLLGAYEAVSLLPTPSRVRLTAQGVTVTAIEPLTWLKKTGHVDRIPEVWSRAVELADEDPDSERVTKQHVVQARHEFVSTLTPKLQRQAVNTPRAVTLRSKAQAYVEDLWKTGNRTEAKKFYDWFIEFLRAQKEEST